MDQKEEFSEKHLKQVIEKWNTEPVPTAEINKLKEMYEKAKEIVYEDFMDELIFGATYIVVDKENNIRRVHPMSEEVTKLIRKIDENSPEVDTVYVPIEEMVEKYKGYLTEEDIVKLTQQEDENS